MSPGKAEYVKDLLAIAERAARMMRFVNVNSQMNSSDDEVFTECYDAAVEELAATLGVER